MKKAIVLSSIGLLASNGVAQQVDVAHFMSASGAVHDLLAPGSVIPSYNGPGSIHVSGEVALDAPGMPQLDPTELGMAWRFTDNSGTHLGYHGSDYLGATLQGATDLICAVDHEAGSVSFQGTLPVGTSDGVHRHPILEPGLCTLEFVLCANESFSLDQNGSPTTAIWTEYISFETVYAPAGVFEIRGAGVQVPSVQAPVYLRVRDSSAVDNHPMVTVESIGRAQLEFGADSPTNPASFTNHAATALGSYALQFTANPTSPGHAVVSLTGSAGGDPVVSPAFWISPTSPGLLTESAPPIALTSTDPEPIDDDGGYPPGWEDNRWCVHAQPRLSGHGKYEYNCETFVYLPPGLEWSEAIWPDGINVGMPTLDCGVNGPSGVYENAYCMRGSKWCSNPGDGSVTKWLVDAIKVGPPYTDDRETGEVWLKLSAGVNGGPWVVDFALEAEGGVSLKLHTICCYRDYIQGEVTSGYGNDCRQADGFVSPGN